MRRLIVLAALLISVAAPALAQQSVLQSGSWTSGHVPIYAPASGSNFPIVVDSGSAPAVINSGNIGQIPYYAATGSVLTGNANTTISAGALTLGITGTTQGSLILSGATSGAISLKPQAVAGTYNWNYPTTAGTTGLPLLSAGGGSSPMTWGSLSGTTSTFATTTGAFTVGHCITTDGSGNLQDSGTGCGGSGTVNSGTAGQFSYYATSTNAVSGTSVLTLSGGGIVVGGPLTASSGADTFSPSNANVVISPSGTGVVTINPGTAGTMNNVIVGGSTPLAVTGTTITANNGLSSGVAGVSLGSLSLSGNTSGTVVVKTQAAAGSYNLNVPITAGTSGQPLLSGGGGSGAMTWGSLSGNTSTFGTTSGALTSGHVAAFDASGNIIDGGTPPTGTINSGTAGRFAYYAGSGTTLSDNANLTVSGGAVTVGVAGSVAGSVAVTGSSTGTITVKGAGTTIGTYNFNLPTTAGSSTNILASGGGGTAAMTWDTVSGNTTVLGTVTGALTNGHCLAADASGNIIDNGSTCGTGGSGTVTSSTAGQVAYYAASTNAVAGNSSLTISGAALTVGVAGATTGSVNITGSTSGTVSIKTQNAAGTYNFNLPITAGSAGQVLTSQGGGATAMTWATAGIAWGGVQSVSFNATSNTRYCIDTAGGAVTMTMPPSPSDGDQIGFIDCTSNFAVTAMTVGRNAKKIMGLTADMTVNTTNAASTLVYVSANGDWRMY